MIGQVKNAGCKLMTFYPKLNQSSSRAFIFNFVYMKTSWIQFIMAHLCLYFLRTSSDKCLHMKSHFSKIESNMLLSRFMCWDELLKYFRPTSHWCVNRYFHWHQRKCISTRVKTILWRSWSYSGVRCITDKRQSNFHVFPTSSDCRYDVIEDHKATGAKAFEEADTKEECQEKVTCTQISTTIASIAAAQSSVWWYCCALCKISHRLGNL